MSGAYAAALPYDLAFPEVFHPTGIPHGQHGFDAVVGNPPWEGVDTSNKEFFAAFDFSILELETEREITDLIASLLRDPAIETDRHRYEARVTATKKLAAALLNHVNRSAGGVSAATPDLYQYFTERAFQCLGGHGRFGLVLPAAVHANEGSAGLRILLLHHMAISCCYSFENKRKLFEIHSSFKFATIVAQRGGPTQEFACAFYLHDDEWLFQSNKCERLLTYSFTFIRLTTGNALNLLELRDKQSVPIVYRMYETKASLFGDIRRSWKVLPTEELHTSKQKHRVTPIHGLRATFRGDVRTPDTHRALLSQGIIPVCKGEDFHQFDSFWDDGPLVATTIEAMSGKEDRLKAARYYRLVFRRQASSTNERTVICHLCAPGLLFFDSALPEKLPQERPTYRALAMVSICNSFSFDWLLRQMVGSNVTFNFLDVAPVPEVSSVNVFMAHCCARLVSQHAGYDSFWREQLGDAWREPGKKLFTWPALAGDDERWAVRAAIDVVVADAYGLSREQYAHVLSTFSHKSYRKAPELCLAAFDELKDIGLEAFCKKHDPYWDIPLNENLPKPVIDLPIPEGAENEGTEAGKKRGAKRSGRNQNATNLWEERDGQLTLNAPGPLFDSAGSPASKSRVRSAPPTPNPGHVAAVRTKLELDKVLTSAEVQDLLKCDASAARAILKQLVDAGIAVTEGKAKGTKYRFAAK